MPRLIFNQIGIAWTVEPCSVEKAISGGSFVVAHAIKNSGKPGSEPGAPSLDKTSAASVSNAATTAAKQLCTSITATGGRRMRWAKESGSKKCVNTQSGSSCYAPIVTSRYIKE